MRPIRVVTVESESDWQKCARALRIPRSGRAPECSDAHRTEIIQGLSGVAEVCVFDVGLDDTDAASRWLADWPVNIVFVSSDWIDTPRWQRLRPVIASWGIVCHVLPYTVGIYATALRQQLV